MPYRIRQLPTARRELERELAWLSRFSKEAAGRLLSAYREKMELLASGALTQDLSSHPMLNQLGYRKALIGSSHLALYYIDGGDLVIAHFFSQREDYFSLL